MWPTVQLRHGVVVAKRTNGLTDRWREGRTCRTQTVTIRLTHLVSPLDQLPDDRLVGVVTQQGQPPELVDTLGCDYNAFVTTKTLFVESFIGAKRPLQVTLSVLLYDVTVHC